MTTLPASRRAPRLGLALLNRLADRNETLAGDLLEGYQLRQSRLWFWRELVGAVLSGGFRKDHEIRPLKLVEYPSWTMPPEDFAAKRMKLQAGLGGSPLQGHGGLSIIALICLMTLAQPALWMLMAFGMLSGVTIGLVRIARDRRRRVDPHPDLTEIVLFNHHARR